MSFAAGRACAVALDPAGLARHPGEVERHAGSAQRRQVLSDVAGAEPVYRCRRRLAYEMDRVPCEEHPHVVALLGGGAGDEQRERSPRWVLRTSGGMDE